MEAATKQSTELRSRAVSGRPHNHDRQLPLKTIAKPKNKCYRCGRRTGHSSSICHFREQKCRKCGKIGHIAKVCNSPEAPSDKQQTTQRKYSSRPQQQSQRNSTCQQTKYEEGETTIDSVEWGILTVHSKLKTTQPSIKVELKINNAEVIMELDTGVSFTIMSESTLR